jgi:hypothetical protein
MQGGFSASPYTGGVSETNSLIKEVSPAAAPISNYSGGAVDNGMIPAAIASIAANANPAAEAAVAPVAPVPAAEAAVEPVEQLPVAPVEQVLAAQVAQVPAVAYVPPQLSSSAPMEILNSNPSANVAIATVASLLNNNSKKIKVAISAVAVNDEKKEEKSDNTERKAITIYGKEYIVPNPKNRKKSTNWDALMAALGFDVLSEMEQQEFKEMIYEMPTCIEEDLPISTSIDCEATRKFIFKVAKKLLEFPSSNSSGKTIVVPFNSEKQLEHVSMKSFELVGNQQGGSDEIEEKQSEKKRGGLRGKKRRTIRKQK